MKRTRSLAGVGVAIVGVGLSVGLGGGEIASAGNQRTESSQIEVLATGPGSKSGSVLILGDIASKTRQCRSARKMTLLVQTATELKLIDRTTSSKRGAWALMATEDEIQNSKQIIIKMASKKVQTAPKRTCSKDHFLLAF